MNLLEVLSSGPELRWIVGEVKSVDTANKHVVIALGDHKDPESPTLQAAYLSHYVPAVGHKVHALAQDNVGVLVLGSTS